MQRLMFRVCGHEGLPIHGLADDGHSISRHGDNRCASETFHVVALLGVLRFRFSTVLRSIYGHVLAVDAVETQVSHDR